MTTNAAGFATDLNRMKSRVEELKGRIASLVEHRQTDEAIWHKKSKAFEAKLKLSENNVEVWRGLSRRRLKEIDNLKAEFAINTTWCQHWYKAYKDAEAQNEGLKTKLEKAKADTPAQLTRWPDEFTRTSCSKPHRCPICGGTGRRQTIYALSGTTVDSNCHTCNGSGIVWG